MLSNFFLAIFCAFFSSSAKCQAPLPIPAPPPTIQSAPTPAVQTENFSKVATLLTGKHTYQILVSTNVPSDAFQLHLKLDGQGTTLTKTLVPKINTLTSRATANEIWLAGITANPLVPWVSSKPVEVGRFTTTTSQPSLPILLGSISIIPQNKTGQNLLNSGQAKITIELAK